MYCLYYNEIIEAIWYVQLKYNAVHTYEDRKIFLKYRTNVGYLYIVHTY